MPCGKKIKKTKMKTPKPKKRLTPYTHKKKNR